MFVFEGARPCISVVLDVENESSLWCLAGVSALHELLVKSVWSSLSFCKRRVCD